jgi:hypothetical protein
MAGARNVIFARVFLTLLPHRSGTQHLVILFLLYFFDL